MKALINNKIVDVESIHPDRGYFYGYGVFETIRVISGKCMFLDDHILRLNNGLNYLGIPKVLNANEVIIAIEALACYNGVLKINVSDENTVFTTRPMTYSREQYEQGYRLMLSSVRRNPSSHAVGIKSMNYLDNIFELEKAKKHGFNDALFLNINEEVCETAVANIFLIEEDKIITPDGSLGLLEGVIRQWVMGTYPVLEEHITLDRLISSEGVFVTNSVMGIIKVVAIDEVSLNQHKIIEQITGKYKEVLDDMGKGI